MSCEKYTGFPVAVFASGENEKTVSLACNASMDLVAQSVTLNCDNILPLMLVDHMFLNGFTFKLQEKYTENILHLKNVKEIKPACKTCDTKEFKILEISKFSLTVSEVPFWNELDKIIQSQGFVVSGEYLTSAVCQCSTTDNIDVFTCNFDTTFTETMLAEIAKNDIFLKTSIERYEDKDVYSFKLSKSASDSVYFTINVHHILNQNLKDNIEYQNRIKTIEYLERVFDINVHKHIYTGAEVLTLCDE